MANVLVLPWARSVLATTPIRWTSLTEALPDELLRAPAAAGEWSALACLQHLIDVEGDVFTTRLRAFLAGEDIAAYDPETQGRSATDKRPAQLAAELARERAQSLAALDEVTVDDLARTALHEEYGPVTLGQMLHHWASHDLMHMVQAERALMQSFLPGSGPWRVTFADHDLGSPAG